ncbi:MAG: hypothetical protein Q9214_008017 [Letrouitia sp. 1 TL-2023]
MSYVPPRGPCAAKSSMFNSCPCFRFMVHPLKAGTSFECDGCGHHASFHKMDSPEDEGSIRSWKSSQQTMEDMFSTIQDATALEEVGEVLEEAKPRAKRKRIADNAENGVEEEDWADDVEVVNTGRRTYNRRRK